MNIGEAIAIFKDIKNEKYSANEKNRAIHHVLCMATNNGITKEDYKSALEWLFCQRKEI